MDFEANISYTNTTVMSKTVCTDFCNEHDYIWAALSVSRQSYNRVGLVVIRISL